MGQYYQNKTQKINPTGYDTYYYINAYRHILGLPYLDQPPDLNLFNLPDLITFQLSSDFANNKFEIKFTNSEVGQWKAVVWASYALSPGVMINHNYVINMIDDFVNNEVWNMWFAWHDKMRDRLFVGCKVFVMVQFVQPDTCFRSWKAEQSIIIT